MRSPYSRYVGHNLPSPLGWIILIFLFLVFFLMSATGCSILNPNPNSGTIQEGHSVLVVTAERELNNMLDTYQEVTEFDHQNLAWMKEHAPDAHQTIQALRDRQTGFWPQYDAANGAIRLYKRSRLPQDGQEIEDKLVVLRDMIRQARLALLAAQAERAGAPLLPSMQPR